MNALQFDALLFELAITQDHVAADVKLHLRTAARDTPELEEFIKPRKRQLPNGQLVNYTLEEQVDSLREQWGRARPVEKRVMQLRARESRLRGDLYEEMLLLDVESPGDARDLLSYANGLIQNPQPGAIADALDLYGGHTCTGTAGHELYKRLLADFESLYPPDKDE